MKFLLGFILGIWIGGFVLAVYYGSRKEKE